MSEVPFVQEDVINPELLKMARENVSRLAKEAFIPSSGGGGAPPMDPAMMGGGGAPPMDPAMMGGGMPPGMPPMDPSMMGGGMPPGMPPMDPSMMGGGGAPPMDPAMMGGGGVGPDQIKELIRNELANSGGQGAGAGGAPKPKVDINAAIVQLSRMVARIADALGIHIPASEMLVGQQDIAGMINQQQAISKGEGAPPPPGGGGGGEAPVEPPPGVGGSIGPMPGIEGISEKASGDSMYRGNGKAESLSPSIFSRTLDKASAILEIRRNRRS